MKKLHKHDCKHCQYLGTVNANDLYFCQDEYNSTIISRFGSKEWEYKSGIEDSLKGTLRIAAEYAIERGLMSREYWRNKAYFKGYYPYSIVKAVMQMSKDELFAFADRHIPFSSTDTPYKLLEMVATKRGWI